MTVGELMCLLQHYDKDQIIYARDCNNTFDDIVDVTFVDDEDDFNPDTTILDTEKPIKGSPIIEVGY